MRVEEEERRRQVMVALEEVKRREEECRVAHERVRGGGGMALSLFPGCQGEG